MGQKSNQIERRIEAERGQLGQNLSELQSKVQEATDWRVQFQKRPMLMLGVAAGGGLLLASLTGRKSKYKQHYSQDRERSGGAEHSRGTELQKNKALETFDTIKGALIGVAANTFQDFLGQLVPGFREQFQKTAQEKRSQIGSAASSSAARSATQ